MHKENHKILRRRAKCIPLPFGARASLFEAGNLNDVEEKCAEGVRHLGIDILQTPAQLGVAIAMRASKRCIIAYAVYALPRRYREWAMIVLPAAGILGCMLAQIVVRFGHVTWSTPFGTRIHQTTAYLILRTTISQRIVHRP